MFSTFLGKFKTVKQEADTEPNKDPFSEYIQIGNREVITDFYLVSDTTSDAVTCNYKVFVRLNGNTKKITNVTFLHCIFDSCYFKECVFDSCKFIGCKFIACNMPKCSFPATLFKYTIFERSYIPDEIITNNAPDEENLRIKFARSLRVNFQQIGDPDAVNKAIAVELKATAIYLKKSWKSKSDYYKRNFPSIGARISQFLKWLEFIIMDFIWGNGESICKLIRLSLIILVMMSFYDCFIRDCGFGWQSIKDGAVNSLRVLFGVKTQELASIYDATYMVLATFARLILFGLFMTVLVKRFGKR